MNDFEYLDDLQSLANAQEPAEAALDRLDKRLAEAARTPPASTPHRVSRWWLVAPLAVAAAAVALVIGSRIDRSTLATSNPAAQAPALAASAPLGNGEVELSEGVVAVIDGQGTTQKEGRDTTIQWVEGSITLRVDPERKPAEVRVTTDEAQVRVVGTVLTVERGPFGTTVSVERGAVQTTCRGIDVPMQTVRAGEEALCLRDAGAGLGRVLLLERQGASAEARLSVIERALAHPTTLQATRKLLVERRIGALIELQRHDEAIEATQELPEPDRLARISTVAHQAMLKDGCEAAERWLVELANAGEVTGTLLRVQCLSEHDRGQAREVLSTIDRRTLSPSDAKLVTEWEEALRR